MSRRRGCDAGPAPSVGTRRRSCGRREGSYQTWRIGAARRENCPAKARARKDWADPLSAIRGPAPAITVLRPAGKRSGRLSHVPAAAAALASIGHAHKALQSSQPQRGALGTPKLVPQGRPMLRHVSGSPVLSAVAARASEPGIRKAPCRAASTRVGEAFAPCFPTQRGTRPACAAGCAHHGTLTPAPAGPDGAPQLHRGGARRGEAREQL